MSLQLCITPHRAASPAKADADPCHIHSFARRQINASFLTNYDIPWPRAYIEINGWWVNLLRLTIPLLDMGCVIEDSFYSQVRCFLGVVIYANATGWPLISSTTRSRVPPVPPHQPPPPAPPSCVLADVKS